MESASLTLGFAISAIPNPGAPAIKPVSAVSPVQQFRVLCKGQPKPDMFAENRNVIVEGRLGAGHAIVATQVLTACPSKYVPKKPS